MNEEIKKRYQLLKEKNSVKIKGVIWKNNVLFTECIDVLQSCNIISLEETENLFEQMQKNFPMTAYGCINWNGVKESLTLDDISEVYHICDVDDVYYILWEQEGIPCVSCQLSTILENIDDVLAVSFDTWLLSKNTREIIEFYHEGRITYGKIPD